MGNANVMCPVSKKVWTEAVSSGRFMDARGENMTDSKTKNPWEQRWTRQVISPKSEFIILDVGGDRFTVMKGTLGKLRWNFLKPV